MTKKAKLVGLATLLAILVGAVVVLVLVGRSSKPDIFRGVVTGEHCGYVDTEIVCSPAPPSDDSQHGHPHTLSLTVGGSVRVANIWVTPSGGNNATAARSSSQVTNPGGGGDFATVLAAYQAASCGDIIAAANGTFSSGWNIGHYGVSQNTEAKTCGVPVVFAAQTPGQVRVTGGGISINEPWVAIQNVTTTSLGIEGWDSTNACYTNPVAHVTFANGTIDAGGAQTNPLYMTNVQYVNIINTRIGNVGTGETEISNGGASPCPSNDHVSLRNNTWHDFINTDNTSSHMECLQIDSLAAGTVNTNFTITGNRFLNCGQYDLFTSGGISGYTITNNWFDSPCSNQGAGCSYLAPVSLGSTSRLVNVVAKFNTIRGYPQFNVGTGATIHSGNVWAYNIDWTGFNNSGECGGPDGWTMTNNLDSATAGGAGVVCSGDLTGDAVFVSGVSPLYNFDLAPASPGIDVLSPCPVGAPSPDIHARVRPTAGHSTCNVGASQANG